MFGVPRSHLVVYGVLVVAVVVFGVRQVARSRGEERAAQASASEPIALGRSDGSGGGGGRLIVHVAGAVRRPGVYRLRAGARVDDAVRRAGGAGPRAELTQVNLAQELEDGRQVVVPARTPAPAPGGPTTAGAGPTAPAGPVNLNTATLEQLDTLTGVGPATAESILKYREEHGGFSNVEELDQVPGIGVATMATLREEVTA